VDLYVRYYHAPTFTSAQLRGLCVVLATDGARLGDAAAQGITADDLPDWLQMIAAQNNRDDLVCVLATIA
jgi:hypothetical protein